MEHAKSPINHDEATNCISYATLLGNGALGWFPSPALISHLVDPRLDSRRLYYARNSDYSTHSLRARNHRSEMPELFAGSVLLLASSPCAFDLNLVRDDKNWLRRVDTPTDF